MTEPVGIDAGHGYTKGLRLNGARVLFPSLICLFRRMFRAYLRSHPDEAKAYAELKMALADRFMHDREAYTESKSAFIRSRLKRAGWNE